MRESLDYSSATVEFNLRNVQVLSRTGVVDGRKGRTKPVFLLDLARSSNDNLSSVSNKIDNRRPSWYRVGHRARVMYTCVHVCICVRLCRNACRRNPLSARIYRGRKKPVVLVVNPHQSGDSRAMPATANSGKTFHSEIRLIQPRGPRLVNFSHRFPFFEIRREALPPSLPPL